LRVASYFTCTALSGFQNPDRVFYIVRSPFEGGYRGMYTERTERHDHEVLKRVLVLYVFYFVLFLLYFVLFYCCSLLVLPVIRIFLMALFLSRFLLLYSL